MDFHCSECGRNVPADEIGCGENNLCIECHEAWTQSEIAHWFPLYKAERAMGFPHNEDEYRRDMIQAGRGHLLR